MVGKWICCFVPFTAPQMLRKFSGALVLIIIHNFMIDIKILGSRNYADSSSELYFSIACWVEDGIFETRLHIIII